MAGKDIGGHPQNRQMTDDPIRRPPCQPGLVLASWHVAFFAQKRICHVAKGDVTWHVARGNGDFGARNPESTFALYLEGGFWAGAPKTRFCHRPSREEAGRRLSSRAGDASS
jgi:hypothetical protein